MKVLTLVCAVSFFGLVGCGKKAPQPTTETSAQPAKAVSAESLLNQPPGDPSAQPQPADPAQPAAAAPEAQLTDEQYVREQGHTDTYQEEITSAYRTFLYLKGHEPKSVNELVGPGYLSRVPPTPPGKHWQMDPVKKMVTLANGPAQ